jgi:enterochelin esterase family protein
LRSVNAKEVVVVGDFKPNRVPMQKDEAGVWSVKVGPLDPDLYAYRFSVDGVEITDPANPRLKTGIRSSQSLTMVPGAQPLFWQEQAVPHGAVHTHWYHSSTIGDDRAFTVYTPPGYDLDPKARYPVLYLLHGAGDHTRSWVDVGQANFILDNLLASKSAVPMIIVMPFGHALPFRELSETIGRKNLELFRDDFIKDVLPAVERQYRVFADRRYRAIAGLSMGGGQALTIGLARLDLFAQVAGFSSAIMGKDLEERFAGVLSNPDQANRELRLLWIGCGKDDRLVELARTLDKLFSDKKIRHTYRETTGAHSWRVWRVYLNELLPLLFK